MVWVDGLLALAAYGAGLVEDGGDAFLFGNWIYRNLNA